MIKRIFNKKPTTHQQQQSECPSSALVAVTPTVATDQQQTGCSGSSVDESAAQSANSTIVVSASAASGDECTKSMRNLALFCLSLYILLLITKPKSPGFRQSIKVIDRSDFYDLRSGQYSFILSDLAICLKIIIKPILLLSFGTTQLFS